MSSTAELIQHLNEVTGLGLALDENNAAAFQYEGRNVLLQFQPELSVCLIHAEVGTLENAALPGAVNELLEANHLLSDTQGGALSWSRQTNVVSMNFLASTATAEAFVNQLNRALSAADVWTERIIQINSEAQARMAEHLKRLREQGGAADASGSQELGGQGDLQFVSHMIQI
jgi:hypothetical protein